MRPRRRTGECRCGRHTERASLWPTARVRKGRGERVADAVLGFGCVGQRCLEFVCGYVNKKPCMFLLILCSRLGQNNFSVALRREIPPRKSFVPLQEEKRKTRVSNRWTRIDFSSRLGRFLPIIESQNSLLPNNLPRNLQRWQPGNIQG